MVRSAVLALIVAAGVSASASATTYKYSYNRNGGAAVGPTAAGIIDTINSTYDTTTKRFTWDVGIGDAVPKNTNGYWLTVSNGPVPRANKRQYVIIFFDARTSTPRVSLFGYNESNFSGNTITPTQSNYITDSAVPGETRIQSQIVTSGNSKTFKLTIDAATINTFFSNPEWEGIQFGPNIGTWFHNTIGTNVVYNSTTKRLTSFSFSNWGFWDYSNLPTTVIPAPSSVALLGLGGLMAARRRRR